MFTLPSARAAEASDVEMVIDSFMQAECDGAVQAQEAMLDWLKLTALECWDFDAQVAAEEALDDLSFRLFFGPPADEMEG